LHLSRNGVALDGKEAGVSVDLAGKEHWDQIWAQLAFPPDIEPESTSLWSHRDRLVHEALTRLLAGRRGQRLIELGCARSAWLPYFAREFGLEIAGLDYSALGAEQTEFRLREAGVPGVVRCGDLFDPPLDWREQFDVVVWFGVAEHFTDTTAAIAAGAHLLKPGGLMITQIPNMAGIIGRLQRFFDRAVYDIHVPLGARELATHHERAGLKVLSAEYVVPLDFGVLNTADLPDGVAKRTKDRVLYALRLITGCVWWLDRRMGPLRPGRATSGCVIVAAEKPLR
jgi:2-polyprenyl-3-methyl-5-hydroxy-6-metoxy-1,4-benzoquinol methylase